MRVRVPSVAFKKRGAMENNYIISCGRTEKRGNWVEVKCKDISVKITDDKKHPISQVELRDICICTINKISDPLA